MESKVKYLTYCVIIFQFFGLLPVSIGKLNRKLSKRFSIILTLYSILLMFTMIYLMQKSGKYENINQEESENLLTSKTIVRKIFHIILFYGPEALISISILNACYNQNVIMMTKFFTNIYEIEELAKENFMTKMNFTNFLRFFLKCFSIVLCFGVWTLYYAYEDVGLLSQSILKLILKVPANSFMLFLRFKFIFFVALINFLLDYVHAIFNEVIQIEIGNVEIQSRFKSKMSQKSYARQNLSNKLKFRMMWKIYNLVEKNCSMFNKSMQFINITDYLIRMIAVISFGYRLCLQIVEESEVSRDAPGK
jgi:hypothetical protein